jgi:hypothetical protein
MDGQVARAKFSSDGQLTLHNLNGTGEKLVVRPCKVHQIGGMDGNGRDVELRKAPSEGRCTGRWAGPTPPRSWVVAEELERGRSNLGSSFG